MYCPECGSLNREESAFCLNCGRKLKTPIEPDNRPEVIETVKKTLSSPLYLVALILLTLSCVIGFFIPADTTVAEIPSTNGPFDKISIEQGYESVAFEEEYDSLFSIMDVIDSDIPWIIALWIIFFLAVGKKEMKPWGIQVAVIVSKVKIYIALVITGLLCLAGFLLLAGEEPFVFLICSLILVPLVGGIGILYLLLQTRVYKDVRALHRMATTGDSTPKISKIVGVACFIFAGATFYGI